MAYKLKISKDASKFLNSGKIPQKDLEIIDRKILSLAEEPYQQGSKKLKGKKGYFRIRAGNYRIVYTVNGNELVVFVVKVGSRSDIYKKLGLL